MWITGALYDTLADRASCEYRCDSLRRIRKEKAVSEEEKLLVIQDIPQFIYERRGIRLALSTLEKCCAPSRNEGPPVAKYWGKRPLRRPSDILAWVDARLRDAPQSPETT